MPSGHIAADRSGELLEATTLDRVVDERPAFAAARLLKIDTDGHDARIIRGGVRWIGAAQPVIQFEYDSSSQFEYDSSSPLLGNENGATFELLAGLGYGTLHIYRNTGDFLRAIDVRDRRAIDVILRETAAPDRDWFPDFTAWPRQDAGAAAAVERHYRGNTAAGGATTSHAGGWSNR